MRKTRAQARRLHIGPTSRPGDLVCLLFSRPKCDCASKLTQAYFAVIFETKKRDFRPRCSLRLVRPEEMLQAKIGKTRFCFFAPASSCGGEFLIDSSSRFPLRIFLNQPRGYKSSY